jgi:hypothetical protein
LSKFLRGNECAWAVEQIVGRERREQLNCGLRIANCGLNEIAPPRQLRRSALDTMLVKMLSVLWIVFMVAGAFAQAKSFDSPNKTTRAVIIPVGAKGYEAYESRVDIRSASGRLLRRKSFQSRDHNHGEGVGHAEWTADGRFFVFNTNSSGGHQPWHVATYVYSVGSNRFYGVDSVAGPITSDFTLRGETLVTTRMGAIADEKVPITIRLSRWR